MHRDINPRNIMIDYVGEYPNPKVTDFGLAKEINKDMTYNTCLAVTSKYGPPENLADEKIRSRVMNLLRELELWNYRYTVVGSFKDKNGLEIKAS